MIDTVVKVIFQFDCTNGFPETIFIYGKSESKMLKVIEALRNKIGKEVDIKDYLFYHNDKIINLELTIYYYNRSKYNDIIISVRKRTKIIKCPDCLYNTCFLEIENYGLHFYGCKCGYDIIKMLDDYEDSQKINYDEIKCDRCGKSYKKVKGIYKCLGCSKAGGRSFYYCNECKINYEEHIQFEKHKSIKYDDENYICLDGSEYSSYCLTCKIDL